jgi:hypothetical protein
VPNRAGSDLTPAVTKYPIHGTGRTLPNRNPISSLLGIPEPPNSRFSKPPAANKLRRDEKLIGSEIDEALAPRQQENKTITVQPKLKI